MGDNSQMFGHFRIAYQGRGELPKITITLQAEFLSTLKLLCKCDRQHVTSLCRLLSRGVVLPWILAHICFYGHML